MLQPFYDPHKSYEHNFHKGPFGVFADKKKHIRKDKPRHMFMGHPIHLPFGIAAGPLINGAYVKAALDKGFDLPVYKTVRSDIHPCHPWPNIVPVDAGIKLSTGSFETPLVMKKSFSRPLAITNSFGVPSFHPDYWQPDMAAAVTHAQNGQLVIGSFQGTPRGGNVDAYIQDFARTAQLVKETGAKVLEANLSCPNEGSSHLLCFDVARTIRVVDAVKNMIGNTPLLVKVAFFVDDRALKQLVQGIGKVVQGISAINTIPAKVVTDAGTQALPGEGRLVSGICGKPIRWAGLDMVWRLKKLRGDLNLSYAVTGVGGVMHPEDYHEYRYVGADAVMSATGAMWNPYLAQDIERYEQ